MADNATADAALRDRIARLRSLEQVPDQVGPQVARAIEAELRANIARGVGPDGTPWKLTQDGRVPLRGAASALTVRALGSTIIVSLEGAESRHHLGRVRGGVRRPIIPTGNMPEPILRAIDAIVLRAFDRAMGGAA